MSDDTDALRREVAALRAEIKTLNGHRFIRVQNSFWLMMFQALTRGMAVGLGTVVGASILVSILLYLLSQIDFLPIIGEWSKDIAAEIRESTGAEPLGKSGRSNVTE